MSEIVLNHQKKGIINAIADTAINAAIFMLIALWPAETLLAQQPTVGALTTEQQIWAQKAIQSNIILLGLEPLKSRSHPIFTSPIKIKQDLKYFENMYFSSFVDHHPGYDTLLDYACGTRTYDKANGYNHQGTDFTFRPFKWHYQKIMLH